MPLGVGIIGAGGMGACHAVGLSQMPQARVTAIMDSDSHRARAVAERVGAEVLAEADELIAHPAVEAVVVASPDRTHVPLTLACIQAGKPVLCEKPLGVSSEEARAVVEAEMKRGTRLVQVGFMRVYDPDHSRLMHGVRSGTLGEPLLVSSTHTNISTGQPRTTAEVLTQSVIHDLHSVRFLTGREIRQVYVSAVPALGELGSAAVLLVSLQLQGGCLGLIVMNSEDAAGYQVAAQVIGSGGVASTPEVAEPHRHWLTRFEVAYRLEDEAFVSGVGTMGGPSSWDGFVTLAAAEACIESAQQNRPVPLALPQRPRLFGSL